MDYRQLKAAAATSVSSAVQEAARMVKEKELKVKADRDKVSDSCISEAKFTALTRPTESMPSY